MGKHGLTAYYKEKLEAGLEYQDFIADQLRKADPCIIISTYSSRKYQNEYGESATGIEIKYDMRFKETGNLYIEIAEKSNAAIAEYSPSGIYRKDNTWLYLIGDYEQAFLFSKHQLQSIHASAGSWESRGIRAVEIDTSRGFLYPAEAALKHGTCLKHFQFSKGGV